MIIDRDLAWATITELVADSRQHDAVRMKAAKFIMTHVNVPFMAGQSASYDLFTVKAYRAAETFLKELATNVCADGMLRYDAAEMLVEEHQ